MAGGPELPPVEALIPHSGSMVLLDRVLAHDPACTVCSVDVSKSSFLQDEAGRVPSWVSVEYMAQCVAAHGGILAFADGKPPGVGLLLGSRRLVLHVPWFQPAARLKVVARHEWGKTTGMVSFSCQIQCAETGASLAEGRLSCLAFEGLPE